MEVSYSGGTLKCMVYNKIYGNGWSGCFPTILGNLQMNHVQFVSLQLPHLITFSNCMQLQGADRIWTFSWIWCIIHGGPPIQKLVYIYISHKLVRYIYQTPNRYLYSRTSPTSCCIISQLEVDTNHTIWHSKYILNIPRYFPVIKHNNHFFGWTIIYNGEFSIATFESWRLYIRYASGVCYG